MISSCSQSEKEIRQKREQLDSVAKEQFQSQRNLNTARFESEYSKLNREYKKAREAVTKKFESDGYLFARQEQQFVDEENKKHAVTLENARQDFNESHQQLLNSLASIDQQPQGDLVKFQQQWEQSRKELDALEQEAIKIAKRRGCTLTTDPPVSNAFTPDHSCHQFQQQFQQAFQAAVTALQQLHDIRLSRFLETGWPLLIGLIATVALVYPCWLFWAGQGFLWLPASAGGGLIVGVATRQLLRPFSKRKTKAFLPHVSQTLSEARAALNRSLQAARYDAQSKKDQLEQQRDNQVNQAQAKWTQQRDELKLQHEARLRQANHQFQQQRQEITETHDRQLKSLDQKYPARLRKLEQDFQQTIEELSGRYRGELKEHRQEFEQHWNELVQRWTTGFTEFRNVVDQMNQVCHQRYPDWEAIDWQSWKASDQPLSVLPFGRFSLDVARLDLPAGDDLRLATTEFALPAVLSYPDCPSLLLEADGEGRDVAIDTLQQTMLRLLTTLPSGKVRFTILDPVGLGQNFSVFMHLADYDERLVTNRIWTESAHINRRLTDLTEHMENVIQKYLRNEFESIQEYNQHAGEVAEPFQILVVANFPANFSEEAARRLVSICSTGARCGVYTLISTDTKLKLPRNFDLQDLERNAATLQWNGSQFRWKQDDLKDLPLQLDTPPSDDQFTTAVRTVGQLAKDSSRVEVPFRTIVPADGSWWTSDSRGEVEVPLGRAGATKLQYMRLGKGTSQHVLIAGKTGSGKSTLLHAMITSMSVHYSPDELQFYLIDFKKGVEFKAYATFGLPHARVIAIESEREFGMSVLERLDQELRERGDLFRAAGAQDIQAYRDANPDSVLPRVLLIIDEFQELFVSDDKIAQDASLLLDRLVRQGRAFGIHVLLGSQTLSGAYSLARSTIGQMAVRIALQCSETDAHLILSEDNTAARLLNRPGEAIYNDANGLFEGNHPFQVVWLPDLERESYLRQIAQLAQQSPHAAKPPIVFEGNVAADPSQNPLLSSLLESDDASSLSPTAWLGAAVAIKDPTAITFRRQSGSNLLIVGQQEEMAMGILSTCLVSLLAQRSSANNGQPSESGSLHDFYLLDGTRPESPDSTLWSRLTDQLSLDLVPIRPRDMSAQLEMIATEINRRVQEDDETAPPAFVIIYNLSRFRDLKKSDEFSFSSDDEQGPAKLLSTILRDGPAVGVHSLVWCDTYNTTNRWLERQAMHDLEMRVLFQMSATDSSNLMDSPAASHLGVHRAILYSEERGQAEKFRPYGLPSAEWLSWVKQRLQRPV